MINNYNNGFSSNYFKIGLDLGYSYVKGANENNKEILLPSIITPGHERKLEKAQTNFFTNKLSPKLDKELLDNLYVTLLNNGRKQEYFVGKLAEQTCTTTFDASHNKIDSNVTEVLLATSIALLAPYDEKPIHLITGLPIEHYLEQNKEFKKMLEEFQCLVYFKDQNFKRKISFDKVTISMQGLGATYHCIWNELERYSIPKTYICIVDPGFKTTDFAVFYIHEDGRPEFKEDFSGTFEDGGMVQNYLKLKPIFKEKSSGELDLSSFNDILKSGKTFFNGNFVDFSKEMEQFRKELGINIKNYIYTKWLPILNKINHVFVCGGTGMEVFPYLQGLTNNISLAKDAQMANAKGYLKIGTLIELAQRNNR